MNKKPTEQTANKMADTAVVTEKPTDNIELRGQLQQLQQENAKLREQLHTAEYDLEYIVRFLEDITAVRFSDVRNLVRLLPNVKDVGAIGTITNVLHKLLDEIDTDVEIISELSIDELIFRYHDDKDKLLRGGEII